jgi:hypothetical protein
MSKINVNADTLAKLKHFSDAGEVFSSVLQSLLNTIRTVVLTASAEVSNVITVSGQVQDAAGNNVAAVADLIITSTPIAGAGTMTASVGTIKVGSASAKIWLQTNSSGAFTIAVTNTSAEDNLISVQLDSGEIETLKITYA